MFEFVSWTVHFIITITLSQPVIESSSSWNKDYIRLKLSLVLFQNTFLFSQKEIPILVESSFHFYRSFSVECSNFKKCCSEETQEPNPSNSRDPTDRSIHQNHLPLLAEWVLIIPTIQQVPLKKMDLPRPTNTHIFYTKPTLFEYLTGVG